MKALIFTIIALLFLINSIDAYTVTAILSWTNNDNRPEVLGSNIEQSIKGGAWKQIYTVGPGVNKRNVPLKTGQLYCYRVKSYTATAESNPSNEVCCDAKRLENCP